MRASARLPIRSGIVVLVNVLGMVAALAQEHGASDKLLPLLSKSKHTLDAGIQQPGKSPVAVISAKFELDGQGKLSLSVYTADKGLDVDAEHNVLKELAGSPDGERWSPETEVFKDVEHVSRASQQLTIMSLTRLSLLDITKKAPQDQPGVVYSITPVVRDRKPVFVVLVAAQDKSVELTYDAMTGAAVKK